MTYQMFCKGEPEVGALLFYAFVKLAITMNKTRLLPRQRSLYAKGNADIYSSDPQLAFGSSFSGEQKGLPRAL